jgi:hypothetical protein
VVLVRTDVSEGRIVSIIRVTRRFEVFTAVTMKNGVLWDVTPCGSCKNIKRAIRRNIKEEAILQL